MHTPRPQLHYKPLHVQDEYGVQALRALLAYLKSHSPFYRKRLEGVEEKAPLHSLPFTTKEDIQNHNWDFLCVPQTAVAEYMATSGTMGKPVTIALTKGDLQRLAYNEAQSFRIAGGSPADRYQLALTLDRQFMAGMAYYSGIQALGASLVRTGPGLPQMQLEVAQRLQTTTLVAVPSFLPIMAEWAEENGSLITQSTITKAVCIGEPIRRSDFSLNTLGTAIAQRWPIALHSTYAATELQTAFTECSAGLGGHHQSDLLLAEIIDEAGTPLPAGTPGEVVVTTLGIEGMPLLRYKTGDMAALHEQPCPCGRTSRRLGPIIGRKGQMIKYWGTTLYPPAIFDVLNEAAYVSAYLVEVLTSMSGTDELLIHLHTNLSPDDCSGKLRSLLQSRLRVAPAIRHHTLTAIQDLMSPPGSRKPLRFIDNRKPQL